MDIEKLTNEELNILINEVKLENEKLKKEILIKLSELKNLTKEYKGDC